MAKNTRFASDLQAYEEYINEVMNKNALAAEAANAASKAAQQQAMDFNEKMAYWQAAQNWGMLNSQQAFNQSAMNQANAFNAQMWSNSANFNAQQQEIAMNYNSNEAEKNRQWQEYMSSTAYQRAIKDLKAAGLNPILAAWNSGASMGSGAYGSTNGATIGSISAAQANSGLQSTGGASVGGYQGQIENTSNMLALAGMILKGLDTTMTAAEDIALLRGQTKADAYVPYTATKEAIEAAKEIGSGVTQWIGDIFKGFKSWSGGYKHYKSADGKNEYWTKGDKIYFDLP